MNMLILLEQLDKTETFDKENVLIDIYIYLIENNVKLNDKLKLFVELSRLRDITLTDGSESFFEDIDNNTIFIEILKQYTKDDLLKNLYEMCIDNQYDKINEWMVENEWIYNDKLSYVIKEAFNNHLG